MFVKVLRTKKNKYKKYSPNNLLHINMFSVFFYLLTKSAQKPFVKIIVTLVKMMSRKEDQNNLNDQKKIAITFCKL